MITQGLTQQIIEGIDEAKRGNTLAGMLQLEKLSKVTEKAEVSAWLGYCVAKEKGEFSHGLNLCKHALEKEPRNTDLYLALGRLYLVAGHRGNAIAALKKGLRMGPSSAIVHLLEAIGIRKDPVFPFVARNNMLNIFSGRLLTRLSLR